MPSSVSSSTSTESLVRVTRSLGSVQGGLLLDAFLRQHEGHARGFWGRGDAFQAWTGVIREWVLPKEQAERFSWLRDRIRGIVPVAPDAEAPRWFGGFSFLDQAEGSSGWEGFPGARFILPKVVLEVQGGEVLLHVQALDEEEATLDAQAEALAEALVQTPNAASDLASLSPVARGSEVSEEHGAEAWHQAVRQVLEAEGRGDLEKVVLARTRDVTFPAPVCIPSVLRFLREENPRAHVFLFEPEPGRILFGAAPEVLASLRGGQFHATAVAGSAPRGKTVHEDQLLRGGLLTSLKDRAEHRMTLEEMVSALESRLSELRVPRVPGVLALARIQHLETPIEGPVRSGEDILSLVEALHPTPAVCGRPREEALRWIERVEPFDRGWYAGPVGWLDAKGEGGFVPALRIGVGGGRTWRLYAGAGIVHGSDPHSEWEETALKFEPAHRALRAGLS